MLRQECGEPSTVGALVAGYLDQQQRQLAEADLSLRDRLDDVHATRVAIRRYRSALRVFGDVFDDDRAAGLAADLQWYAGLLGAVRDTQVLKQHLAEAITRVPSSLPGRDAARALIDRRLKAELRRARAELRRAMRTKRYQALLDEVHSWRLAVPFTDRATREPAAVAAYLHTAKRTMAKRVRDASDDGSMHRARKAAKRARYAADLAEPVLRKQARHVAKRAKQVQIELGERQDSAVARGFLLGLIDGAPPDAAFVLGALYDREQRRPAG